MGSNRGSNLKTRLCKVRILWVEHDVSIERLLGLSTGHEGEHDMTM